NRRRSRCGSRVLMEVLSLAVVFRRDFWSSLVVVISPGLLFIVYGSDFAGAFSVGGRRWWL
ncbi:9215_t:CDS:1, partial [Dentiscutata heterogama]